MKDIINLLKNKKLVSFFISFTIYATLCFENIVTTYNLLSILLFIVIYIFIYNAKAKYNRPEELSGIVNGAFDRMKERKSHDMI